MRAHRPGIALIAGFVASLGIYVALVIGHEALYDDQPLTASFQWPALAVSVGAALVAARGVTPGSKASTTLLVAATGLFCGFMVLMGYALSTADFSG